MNNNSSTPRKILTHIARGVTTGQIYKRQISQRGSFTHAHKHYLDKRNFKSSQINKRGGQRRTMPFPISFFLFLFPFSFFLFPFFHAHTHTHTHTHTNVAQYKHMYGEARGVCTHTIWLHPAHAP